MSAPDVLTVPDQTTVPPDVHASYVAAVPLASALESVSGLLVLIAVVPSAPLAVADPELETENAVAASEIVASTVAPADLILIVPPFTSAVRASTDELRAVVPRVTAIR